LATPPPFARAAPCQAQLAELRRAQEEWEAERQLLHLELEEERQHLQEGLAAALTHASSAQRQAAAATERAQHWCSLAQWLQRSALLPDSPGSEAGAGDPASPSSLASLPSPASGGKAAASPCVVAGSKQASNRCATGCSSSPAAAWLAGSGGDEREAAPAAAATPDRAASGGLIAAFHAVAASDSADQLQGSPVLQRYPASGQLHSVPSGAELASRCGSAELAESADLAPGSHLALLLRLPTPGLSFASSAGGGLGPSPLMPTPPPFAAQLSTGGR
jgi:hypothetical protein